MQAEILAGRMARRVTPKQSQEIVHLLTPAPKGPVKLNVVFDGEALQFAEEIRGTLKAAGFDPQDVPFPERAMAFTRPGVFIWVHDIKNQPKHAGAIYTAFKRQGIVFTGGELPEIPADEVRIGISSHP
jgi:hypothetical protein